MRELEKPESKKKKKIHSEEISSHILSIFFTYFGKTAD